MAQDASHTHSNAARSLEPIPAERPELFKFAVDAAPAGMLLADQRGSIVLVNAQLERLFGYARQELLGNTVELLLPVRAQAPYAASLAAYVAGRRPAPSVAASELFGLRKDGRELPIEVEFGLFETEEGPFVLSSIQNVGAHKRTVDRLRKSLAEQETLLKEAHHRVKSNLQVVSSLLSLQAHYLTDSIARSAFAESQARIQSIALVHAKLYPSAAMTEVPFSEYMRDLIENLRHAHAADQRGISCVVQHSELRLSPDTCVSCGLVVNELVTNALKHAFPDRRPGKIEVTFCKRDGKFELVVQDNGVGVPEEVNPARATTLGLDLVAAFARRLKGELQLARGHGSTFRLRFAQE